MEYKTVQPDGLGFSQFKLRLSEWQKASGRGLSMLQVHHAGETVQVDYAGDTVAMMDDGTARAARAAQIFVACLPCSRLIYAEGDIRRRDPGSPRQQRVSPRAHGQVDARQRRPSGSDGTGCGRKKRAK
jgi:hypothetical protein